MYHGLMNIYDEALYILFILLVIYTCISLHLEDFLFAGEGEAEREKTKLGSTVVNQVSLLYLPIYFLYFKADCMQFLRVRW